MLAENLDKKCTKYKMKISAEKTKLMRNSTNDIQREIMVEELKRGTVTSFKYREAIVSVVSENGSEALSRIAQASAALTIIKPIQRDNNISVGSEMKLMHPFYWFKQYLFEI